jgi:hypothetical protein
LLPARRRKQSKSPELLGQRTREGRASYHLTDFEIFMYYRASPAV